MFSSFLQEEVFGTAYATAHYLQKHSKGKVYVVAGEPLKKELDARNVPCFGPGVSLCVCVWGGGGGGGGECVRVCVVLVHPPSATYDTGIC